MSRVVVDTNVAIVANGASDSEKRPPSYECRIASIKFLQTTLSSGKILVDLAGAIQNEYRRKLNPSGQPGVGDRFYQVILNSSPQLVERVDLPILENGEYADLPELLVQNNFDPSDRKFAALAKRCGVPVINATDSDWLIHQEAVKASGISVKFVCGICPEKWFSD